MCKAAENISVVFLQGTGKGQGCPRVSFAALEPEVPVSPSISQIFSLSRMVNGFPLCGVSGLIQQISLGAGIVLSWREYCPHTKCYLAYINFGSISAQWREKLESAINGAELVQAVPLAPEGAPAS